MHSAMNGNEEAPTLPEKAAEGSDNDELKFGWLNFRPKAAQCLNRPIMFLFIAVTHISPQVILPALLPVMTMTLKIRFNLSDRQVNTLTVVYGISAMLSVIVMGYVGSFRNKIRWITVGMIITGIGGIFFSLPHFVIDNYEPMNLPEAMLSRFGMCNGRATPCITASSVKKTNMALFVIGQTLIGAGIGPIYSLVPAYIDENVRPQSMPMYIMVWFLNVLLAPILALLVGSMFLGFYVDLKQPKLFLQLTPDDIRWLGAWWLPYLFFGVLTLASALNVLGFPQRLPGSRANCVQNIQEGNIPRTDPTIKRELPGIFHATVSLLKNKTYVFNTMAICCTAFYVVAVGPFLIRIMMIKYGEDPKKVFLPFGIVLFLGSIAGIVLGGFLVKRLGLKTIVKSAAFICLVVEAVSLFTPLLFVIPGCNESSIAGVSRPYPPLGNIAMLPKNGTSELTATCNAPCKCSTSFSKPVCGSNNVAYFDPCHAGCINRLSKKDFANCTCVPATKPGYRGGEAKFGFCDRACKSWALFLVVLFVVLVILGTNALPSVAVVLRCVPHNQRSYALSLQAFLTSVVAFIPQPLIGYIMDKDCNIWRTDYCGRKSFCWDYKANSMAKSLAIFGFLVTALAMVFYFLAWYFCDTPQSTGRNGRLLSDTDGDQDDHSKETNL